MYARKQPGLVHLVHLTRIKVGELLGLRQDPECGGPMFADDSYTRDESKVTCVDCRCAIDDQNGGK